MDKELINKFIAEIAEDYERYGQGKDTKEWLVEAVKRHIIGVDDAKASEIADEILGGIKTYRETAAKFLDRDPLDILNQKLSPEDRKHIEQETRLIAETAVQDIEATIEEVKQNEQG